MYKNRIKKDSFLKNLFYLENDEIKRGNYKQKQQTIIFGCFAKAKEFNITFEGKERLYSKQLLH